MRAIFMPSTAKINTILKPPIIVAKARCYDTLHELRRVRKVEGKAIDDNLFNSPGPELDIPEVAIMDGAVQDAQNDACKAQEYLDSLLRDKCVYWSPSP